MLVRSMCGVLLGTVCSVCSAQFLNNLPIGNAKAIAMGGAVTADYTAVDAIHFNPAALVNIKRSTKQLNVLTATLESRTQFGQRDLAADQLAEFLALGLNTEKLVDPLENTESELNSDEPILYIPGAGPTDLPLLAAPVGGVAIPFPDGSATVATNIYSPLAVGYTRSDDDPGRYQGKSVTMVNIRYFNPAYAMRISDTFAMGGALNFGWTGVAMDMDLRAANLILAALQSACMIIEDVFKPCASSLGPYEDIGSLSVEVEEGLTPTFNLGVLWEPTPWFSWGATYRTGASLSLEGEYEFSYSDNWQTFWKGINVINLPILPNGKQASERGKLKLEMQLPDEVQTGISVRLFPRLKVNLDARWTEYSAWDTFDLFFDKNLDFLKIASLVAPEDAGPTSLLLPRNYRDTWAYGIGVEYAWNDALDLRAGYEYRQSMADSDKQDLIIPLGPANYFGMGFGYKTGDQSVFDLGIGFLDSRGRAKSCESTIANSCRAGDLIYNPYGGLNMKTKTQAYFFVLSYQSGF